MTILLKDAQSIANAALAKAREMNMNACSIAVVNCAGQVKILLSEDESALLRNDIAVAKAWSCMGIGHGTRMQADFAQKMPHLYASFVAIAGGRMVPAPGGVIILDGDAVIGAVGVSGDLPDRDEACAVAGVTAAGFTSRLD